MKMANYDLSHKFFPNLDPHLVFPLLEFHHERKIYEPKQILTEILEIVNKTKMIDYNMDTRKRLGLGDEMTQELIDKRATVIENLDAFYSKMAPIMQAAAVLNANNAINSEEFLQRLKDEHNFGDDHLQSAIKLAKLLYESGNYQKATAYMYFCIVVMPTDHPAYSSILWGKLAAEMLSRNWGTALEDFKLLRTHIDANMRYSAELLQQRLWLLHWSVFLGFNHPDGREFIIEMVLKQKHYMSTIQTACPHLLRYLSAAVILKPAYRHHMCDLVEMIQLEEEHRSDPLINFLRHLYIGYDMQAAQRELQKCEDLVRNDFFLVEFELELMQQIRLLFLDLLCRTHSRISFKRLGEHLILNESDVRELINFLVGNGQLIAHIDEAEQLLVIPKKPAHPLYSVANNFNLVLEHAAQLVELVEQKYPSEFNYQ